LEYTNPGRVFVEKFGPPQSAEDVVHYVRFLREEAGVGTEPPVDLVRIYDRFGIQTPKRAPLPDLQGLLLNPETGLIIVNDGDPVTRQRFTEAHELMELLFSALPAGRGWAARRVGGFRSNVKENLCNEGAAELLMPWAAFVPRICRSGVSYHTAWQLTCEFQVSTTAALVQMVRAGPGRHAAVLWRMKNKPTELRAQGLANQPSLFGDPLEGVPSKKLRIEWAWNGPEMPYLPTDKSVPEGTSIYAAWRDQVFTTGEDTLDLGTVKGVFRCENHPFDRKGERFVLSLLHLPGDMDCGPHP